MTATPMTTRTPHSSDRPVPLLVLKIPCILRFISSDHNSIYDPPIRQPIMEFRDDDGVSSSEMRHQEWLMNMRKLSMARAHSRLGNPL